MVDLVGFSEAPAMKRWLLWTRADAERERPVMSHAVSCGVTVTIRRYPLHAAWVLEERQAWIAAEVELGEVKKARRKRSKGAKVLPIRRSA